MGLHRQEEDQMVAVVVAVVEVVAAAVGIKLHYRTAAGSIEQPVHC